MNKYLLLGLGISNRSIQKFFDKHNIKYIVYDDNNININNNNYYYYMNDLNNLKDINYIVKSNGVDNDHKLIKMVKSLNKDVLVLSEQ